MHQNHHFHQIPLKINKNPKINPPSTITIPESAASRWLLQWWMCFHLDSALQQVLSVPLHLPPDSQPAKPGRPGRPGRPPSLLASILEASGLPFLAWRSLPAASDISMPRIIEPKRSAAEAAACKQDHISYHAWHQNLTVAPALRSMEL